MSSSNVECFTTFVSNVWTDIEGEVCDEYGMVWMVWMERHVLVRGAVERVG